jgi:hypothetical protein
MSTLPACSVRRWRVAASGKRKCCVGQCCSRHEALLRRLTVRLARPAASAAIPTAGCSQRSTGPDPAPYSATNHNL